jgi:hypothetical protein
LLNLNFKKKEIMNTGCRLRLEWVPEAYKADGVDNNRQPQNPAERRPLAGKGLYGHPCKKHPGKLGYSKK